MQVFANVFMNDAMSVVHFIQKPLWEEMKDLPTMSSRLCLLALFSANLQKGVFCVEGVLTVYYCTLYQ